MKIGSRFTIAIHTLLFIYKFDGVMKTSSANIASSVGVNPVIIREILSDLKNANLITVKFGTGGASLNKKPEEISLLDIYKAIIKDEDLFSFHKESNLNCPIGQNIHNVLDEELISIKECFDEKLQSIKLSQLTAKIDTLTKKQTYS